MKSKNKKQTSIKTAVIAGIVGFFLFLPNVAQAFVLQFLQIFKKGAEMSAVAIARGALAITTQFIFDLLNWLVRAGGAFFNGMLNIGFKSHLDIVKAGWQVTRDFSNMFFILFLVIIAFATILRFEKYGIKQLLPKIILIALLINFSLVICSVVIDFSNITANFFIKDINQIAGKGGVSGNFVDSLNLLKTHTVMECDTLPNEPVWPPDGVGSPGPSLQEQCIESRTTPAAAQIGSDVITFAISMTVGSLVMLIAAFVLFAGGAMLLIRIVIIWFLVILVPFVFVCYIMPALRQNWQKWWKTFLQWCFFAPAYAFFIWLAMKVSLEAKTQELARVASGDFTDVGPLANIFLSTPANALIHYFFIIALLLGGLIAASKFGIYGADAAMKIVQKAGKGAKAWAARTTMRPVAALRTQIGAGALTAGRKLFGGKFGRRMEARAIQLRRKPEERPEHKKYGALLGTMANENVLKEVETAYGIRKLIAAKEAKKRGLLREAERTTVKQAAKSMRAFGSTEEARMLEELRPDAMEAPAERKAAIERAIKEGTHKKWSKKVFESPEGTKIVEETRRQLGTDEFAKTFKGWAKDIQEQAETALKASFTDDFANTDNIESRKIFAAVSGKAYEAFFGDKTSTIQPTYKTNVNAQNQAKIYVQGLKDENFGKLDGNEDKALAAQYMTTSQVHGAGIKLSGADKEYMKRIAEKFNREVFEQMKISTNWGGSATKGNIVDLKEKKITPGTEEEFRKAREKYPGPEKKPFG